MIEPIFIRADESILNIVDVKNVWHDAGSDKTYLSYHSDTCDTYLDGDVREELWGLIKFAMAKRGGNVIELAAESKPESQPEAPVDNEFTIRCVIGKLADGTPVYAA